MLRPITLLLIIFFGRQTVLGQLRWSNPGPSGYNCTKIIFTNSQNGFILNTNGDLIRTQNQGATWEIVHNFYAASAFTMCDSTGIIAAYNAIYLSTDNGITWQKTATSFTDNYVGIDIIGRDTIIIAGVHTLYKSLDRGQTWQVIDLGNIIIKSLNFITANLGFVGKSNTSLLKTTNGGQNWQELLATGPGSNGFTVIQFLNADTGYTFRQTDTIYKTTNGGASWQGARMGASDMYDISFPTSSVGYIAGDYGVIYRTSDAGTTWNDLPFTLNFTTQSIYFLSADTGFAVGVYGKILKTTNGGQTWKANSITNATITALAFPAGNTGYAATAGNLFKTTDAAKSWTQLSLTVSLPNNSGSFRYAQFFSSDTGFVTASNPARVFKTSNGGQTWRTTTFTTPLAGVYYDDNAGISFINDSIGFITLTYFNGYGLYKTKDRGETWKKIDSNRSFSQISFLNERTGYAVMGYQLYRTNDSAHSWSLVYTNNNIISSIQFTSAKNGFIGANGIKRTTDSGRTWVNTSGITANNINYMKFLNGQVGYCNKGSGAIYQTQDSGRTWLPKSLTGAGSNAITFYKDSLVYMGGTYGNIASIPVDTNYTSVPVCQGSGFVFTADAVASYSNYDAYQWQVDTGSGFINILDNEIYSGVNTYQLILNSIPASWTNYKYRCRLDYSRYSRVYRFRFTAQWTGAISSAWENPDNWSCGLVPDSNTDVVITNGPVVLHSNRMVRSLRLHPNVLFTIDPGYTLTIAQ